MSWDWSCNKYVTKNASPETNHVITSHMSDHVTTLQVMWLIMWLIMWPTLATLMNSTTTSALFFALVSLRISRWTKKLVCMGGDSMCENYKELIIIILITAHKSGWIHVWVIKWFICCKILKVYDQINLSIIYQSLKYTCHLIHLLVTINIIIETHHRIQYIPSLL